MTRKNKLLCMFCFLSDDGRAGGDLRWVVKSREDPSSPRCTAPRTSRLTTLCTISNFILLMFTLCHIAKSSPLHNVILQNKIHWFTHNIAQCQMSYCKIKYIGLHNISDQWYLKRMMQSIYDWNTFICISLDCPCTFQVGWEQNKWEDCLKRNTLS